MVTSTTNIKIDAYINKSADFARPILIHLRKVVHKACPDVQEKIKWGMPHFDYKDNMLCSMASFKQHCAFSFWKASLMKDKTLMMNAKSETSMGHLGRITSLKDLPSEKKLISYIKEAMKLNDEGVKLDKKPQAAKTKLNIPKELASALQSNRKAERTFNEFSYSNKKEYVEWIRSAKTVDTRNKRLETAVEWLEEGKVRHWKYKS
jgi:uncharacterized protein YdeI (YjbR/CyaY-like superfamily)